MTDFNALPLAEKILVMQSGDKITDRQGHVSRFIKYEAATWQTTPEPMPCGRLPYPGGRIIGSNGCWNMRGRNWGLKWGDIEKVERETP